MGTKMVPGLVPVCDCCGAHPMNCVCWATYTGNGDGSQSVFRSCTPASHGRPIPPDAREETPR